MTETSYHFVHFPHAGVEQAMKMWQGKKNSHFCSCPPLFQFAPPTYWGHMPFLALPVKVMHAVSLWPNIGVYGSNSTWLDSTRHIRRVEPMHFGCVELVEEHSSTRSTRRARLAQLARRVELDRRYLQLSYDHRNSYCLISYSLINWSIH